MTSKKICYDSQLMKLHDGIGRLVIPANSSCEIPINLMLEPSQSRFYVLTQHNAVVFDGLLIPQCLLKPNGVTRARIGLVNITDSEIIIDRGDVIGTAYTIEETSI